MHQAMWDSAGAATGEVHDEAWQLFEQRYTLRRKLGDGGTAGVWAADPRAVSAAGQQFACKLLRQVARSEGPPTKAK